MTGFHHPLVAIIGAGPYGLSIATHLRRQGVDFRIFGAPLYQWRAHCPRGMFLKSEGFASNLFDPNGYSLKRFCAENGVRYGEYGVPVALETFVQYGLTFQRQLVPMVENTLVSAVERSAIGFTLRLESGGTVQASSVVVATGMSNTSYIPEVLTQLPEVLVSHRGDHGQLSEFRGRDVTVIGGGQSALETAALLHEGGANVRVVLRKRTVSWNEPPETRRQPLIERIRRPMSYLGPGLGPWVYSNAPLLFHYLPAKVRLAKVQTALGPAGAWWLRERVMGRVRVLAGCAVRAARNCGELVLLNLEGPDGKKQWMETDHIIAATGYRFTLRALPFLSNQLVSQVCSIHETPILSANFESSIPGLYFTGLASANQFGPAMRFLHGARYTAERVSRHIAERRRCFGWSRPPMRKEVLKFEEF